MPVFCLDDRLLHGRHASGPRTQFLLECLADLDASLRERGSGLVVRHGPPERELAQLAREMRRERRCTSPATSAPFARERGERVARRARRRRARAARAPGARSRSTTSARRARRAASRTRSSRRFTAPGSSSRGAPCSAAPRQLPALPGGLAKGAHAVAATRSGCEQEVARARAAAASARARSGSRDFLARDVERLRAAGATRSARRARSRLSPYLHFGCVSPRELEQRLPSGAGPAGLPPPALLARLLPPRAAALPAQRALRVPAALPRQDRAGAGARGASTPGARAAPGSRWSTPAMRQLRREGWMHNRARLVVGSFLTKDLGIDWRWGERWFMRLLLDGDEANNNGNWQWIASVGIDPQPVFRRIFNPARQSSASTPTAPTSAATCPELRDVPDEYLREPWTMPRELQRAAGCVIGSDYPRADRRPRAGPARGARALPRRAEARARCRARGRFPGRVAWVDRLP